jgi:hypothetical protein
MVDLLDPTGAQDAAREAARVQQEAAVAAVPIQQQAFLGAQQNIQPFVGVGEAALGSRAALAGLGGQAGQEAAFGQLAESPGQRFIRDRQQRALLRNASAIGGLGGGNVRTALQQQASGFALQDIENQRRELAQLSGGGLQAGTTLGALGAATAGNIADLTQAQAAARATGIIGAQQAQAGGLEQAIGAVTTLTDLIAEL